MNCKKCNTKLIFANTVCKKCGTDNFPTNCRRCQAGLKKGSAICPKCKKNNYLFRPWMKITALVLAALLALSCLAYGLYLLCVPRKNDVFYKYSYTSSPITSYGKKQFQKKMDTVVATMGDAKLTNGLLQAYYWMEARDYVNSAKDKGLPAPDLTKGFHSQVYDATTGMSWQQYFLQEALNTWHAHQFLMQKAAKAGYVLPDYYQKALDNAEAELTSYATNSGFANVEEYIHSRLGEGADLQDYLTYLKGNYTATLYRQEIEKQQTIPDAEINAYFEANKDTLKSQHSVTKETGDVVDLRLILVSPEGGEENSDGDVIYTEDEWKACYEEANTLYQKWLSEKPDENSFMALSTYDTLAGDMKKGDLDNAIEAWCFDESRVAGDHNLIQGSEGYYLAYFLAREAEWARYSRKAVLETRMTEIMDTLASQNPITIDYKSIVLGSVTLT